jgi:transposase InsO family protein
LELASGYGRYGYRRVTALLRGEGWTVNHKRVERIWRQEGLKVPQKQPKRRRLWLADGSCIRLRAGHRNHVWSYDFVADRTADGRPIRMLVIVDEHTRECLSIDVARRLTSEDVLERLSDLFVCRVVRDYIRSDNCS